MHSVVTWHIVPFTLCMLRFASVTVNLGPTFLSGALAANAGAVMDEPSCPLVQVTGGRLGFLNFDIYL